MREKLKKQPQWVQRLVQKLASDNTTLTRYLAQFERKQPSAIYWRIGYDDHLNGFLPEDTRIIFDLPQVENKLEVALREKRCKDISGIWVRAETGLIIQPEAANTIFITTENF